MGTARRITKIKSIEEFVRANAIDGYDRTGEYASEIRQMLASMNPNDEKSKKEVASAIALILARMMNLKVKRARD